MIELAVLYSLGVGWMFFHLVSESRGDIFRPRPMAIIAATSLGWLPVIAVSAVQKLIGKA